MNKLTIVVPCYNEAGVLSAFYEEICRVSLLLPELEWIFLFVDDGSKDGTLDELKKLSGQDSRVQYLSFSRNFGKEAAIYAGLKNAGGDYVVLMDADLQDPPALLPEMYHELTAGDYDSIGTRRITRTGEPPVRSFFARAFYRLMNRISQAEIVDGARDYRLMNRRFVDSLLAMSEYNRFSKGLFGWIGFKTKWIEFENVERVAGETKWSFWKLFRYGIDGVVAFSTMPLVLSSFIGILCCIFSFCFAVFIVLRKLLYGNSAYGWASMITVILLIAGLQFLCIGILGNYLAKTYLETKKRPLYFIREDSSRQ